MPVPPVFTSAETLTAEKLQALGSVPEIYTPELTAATSDPALGTGHTAEGIWVQTGPLVHYWFSFQMGSSGFNAGDGQWRVSVPVPVDPGALVNVAVGSGRAIDTSASASRLLDIEMLNTDPSKLILAVEGAVTVTHASPWAWAASDRLFGHASYIGAF